MRIAVAILIALTAGLIVTVVRTVNRPMHPTIIVDNTVHDFGDVIIASTTPLDELTHTFILSNQSDASVRVDRITTTCGCTAVDTPDDEIAPGNQHPLEVRLDVGSAGFKDAVISVFLSNGDRLSLGLAANILHTQTIRATNEVVVFPSDSGVNEVTIVATGIDQKAPPTIDQLLIQGPYRAKFVAWEETLSSVIAGHLNRQWLGRITIESVSGSEASEMPLSADLTVESEWGTFTVAVVAEHAIS